jgi:hypothetical protein
MTCIPTSRRIRKACSIINAFWCSSAFVFITKLDLDRTVAYKQLVFMSTQF